MREFPGGFNEGMISGDSWGDSRRGRGASGAGGGCLGRPLQSRPATGGLPGQSEGETFLFISAQREFVRAVEPERRRRRRSAAAAALPGAQAAGSRRWA